MLVKYNKVKDVNHLNIEYMCRNWNNYLILVSIGNNLVESYYKVVKLVRSTRDNIIKQHQENNSESIVIIALNETDPYSVARNFLQKYFE
jgi:hypothetical protein